MKETSSTPLELNALHLPDAPTWWPLAWGWWAGAASIVLVVVIIMLVIRWKRKRMAPKKTALRLLNPHLKQTPSSAIELLRQAALCYFPREEIAHLTGNAWYTFLDTQVGRPYLCRMKLCGSKPCIKSRKSPTPTRWSQTAING